MDIKRYIFGPFNKAKKYVVSNETVDLTWKESILISDDIVARIKALKVEGGPRLQVHGSGMLVQTFLKNDLVDELRLRIFPVTLGTGKRIFAEGTIPAAFELIESKSSPTGVIIANYKRSGEINRFIWLRNAQPIFYKVYSAKILKFVKCSDVGTRDVIGSKFGFLLLKWI